MNRFISLSTYLSAGPSCSSHKTFLNGCRELAVSLGTQWVKGEKKWGRSSEHKAAIQSDNLLTGGCIAEDYTQLALSQYRLGIRWQSSHAKAAASHTGCGSHSSTSAITPGQTVREAEMWSAWQARSDCPPGLPSPLQVLKSHAGKIVIQIFKY